MVTLRARRSAASGGAVTPRLTAPPDQRVSSADAVSTVAAISGAAVATDAVTRAVGLVTEQVDVQEVDAEAAPTRAAIATVAAVAASAAAVTAVMTTTAMTAATIPAATGVEQGQDGTGGK